MVVCWVKLRFWVKLFKSFKNLSVSCSPWVQTKKISIYLNQISDFLQVYFFHVDASISGCKFRSKYMHICIIFIIHVLSLPQDFRREFHWRVPSCDFLRKLGSSQGYCGSFQSNLQDRLLRLNLIQSCN